jgi:hypothetical protein
MSGPWEDFQGQEGPWSDYAKPVKAVPALRGSGTQASPFDLSGGYAGVNIPLKSYYRDARGNVRQNQNGLLRPDGKPQGNPIIPPPKKPSVAGDVARSGLIGAVQGLDPLAGAGGDLRSGLDSIGKGFGGLDPVRAWRSGMDAITAPARRSAQRLQGSGLPGFSQIGDAALGAMDLAAAGNPLQLGARAAPTTSQVVAARQVVAGPDYVPQTTAGRYARAAGRMLPNAVVPGGVVKKAAAVALPAAFGEAGRGTAEMMGAGQGGQAVAEIAGQLVGGGVAGVNPGNVRNAVSNLRLPPPRKAMNYSDIGAVEESLRAAKQTAYKAVDDAGAVYTPQATTELAAKVAAAAASRRINPLTAGRAVGVLQEIEKAAGKPMTLDDLDSLRQFVGQSLGDGSDAEKMFGQVFKSAIDDFIDSASPELMSSGNPEIAATLVNRARQANQRWRKVEDLAAETGKRSDRAAMSGTGGNEENALRQGVYRSMERQRGLTPGEEAAYRAAAIPTGGQKILRSIGRLSPETGGLQNLGNTAMALGGFAAGGAPGAVIGTTPMVAGFVAKRIADGMTRNRVTALVQTLATGGPEAQIAQRELQALARTNPDVAGVYNEIITQLMSGGGLGAALGASSYQAPATGTAGQ